jgi:hypothetical protein
MCCIALQSYVRTKEVPVEYEGTAPALIELYRARTVQCLILTDLTKPVSNQKFPFSLGNDYLRSHSDKLEPRIFYLFVAGLLNS